jgi:hypothetical protein
MMENRWHHATGATRMHAFVQHLTLQHRSPRRLKSTGQLVIVARTESRHTTRATRPGVSFNASTYGSRSYEPLSQVSIRPTIRGC